MPRASSNKTGKTRPAKRTNKTRPTKRTPVKKSVEKAEEIKTVNEMSEETKQETPQEETPKVNETPKQEAPKAEETVEKKEINVEELKEVLREIKEKEFSLREMMQKIEASSPGRTEDKSHKKFGTALRKEIEPKDRLRVPRTYIYTGGVYVMSVYEKAGVGEVYAPYEKPVVFSNEQTISKKTMDGPRHFRMSTYSTYSRKECQFIENSPEWQMTIFENTTQALKAPIEITYQIQKASRQIGALPDNVLLRMANDYQIDMNLEMSEIRYLLKQYKLAEILQEDKSQTHSMMQNVLGEKARNHLGLSPVEANR